MGGCPPSAFRLLPCGIFPPGACSPAHCVSSRTPYFEVLDQNRWASTCFADTLRRHLTAFGPRKERGLLGAKMEIQERLTGNWMTVLLSRLENPELGRADGRVHQFEVSRIPADWCHLGNLPAGIDFNTQLHGAASRRIRRERCGHLSDRFG